MQWLACVKPSMQTRVKVYSYAAGPLGGMPTAASIAGVPLFSSTQPPAVVPQSSHLPLTSAPTLAVGQPQAQPVVISPALPPIPAKLATKITSGAFIEMRELLPDNLSLRRTLEIQDEYSSAPANKKPPLREVQNITSWVCCMATYFAVLAASGNLRPDHLAYMRLVVHEATKYRGDGWRVYDATFRQNMAAGAPGMEWSKIDAGLHAVSFQSMRDTAHTCCTLCLEPDHQAHDCALQGLSATRPSRQSPQGYPRPRPAARAGQGSSPYARHHIQVCHSWNSGTCSRDPDPCRYEHVCSRCAKAGFRRSHKFADCRREASNSAPARPGAGSSAGGPSAGRP